MVFEGPSTIMMPPIAVQGRHGCRIVEPPPDGAGIESFPTPPPPNHAFLSGDTEAPLCFRPLRRPGRERGQRGLPGRRSAVVPIGSVSVRTARESHLLS
jgi:hypothetical protein